MVVVIGHTCSIDGSRSSSENLREDMEKEKPWRRFIDFDPASGFAHGLLGFLLGSRVDSRFAFSCPIGDWGNTRIVGIGLSPSKQGMGEIKLSRAYIQTHNI
jgi:hypothetical protein